METETTNLEIEKRKEEFLKKIKENKNIISYVVLFIIIWISYYIRTLNLKLLIDVSTGKYIPSELDSFVFLRYAKEIIAHGSVMLHDALRYVPLGFDTRQEANGVSYVVAYMYKFLHIFNPKITLEYIDTLYPAIFFCISLIFFYLLIKKIFNSNWIALLSCAFLTVIPGYLYRTMAGFADKEALGLCLMFMTFYFLVCSFQEKSLKKSLIYSALASLGTVLMALSWGGTSFVFMVIGPFMLLEIFFNKIEEKDIYSYSIFMLVLTILLPILSPERYPIEGLITSVTSASAYLALIVGVLYYSIHFKNIFNLKHKIESKIPTSIFSLITTIIAGFVFLMVVARKATINEIVNVYYLLTEPFGSNRWELTVAESHQPFFYPDWISQMNIWFILLFLAGSILLFYNLMKPLEKKVKQLTILYTLFISAFIFSRYSSDSTLNGSNSISLFFYLGSLAIFLGILIYGYLKAFYKDHALFLKIKELNKTYTFIFVWVVVMIIAARSAIRLLVILIPVATILVSYFVVSLINYIQENQKWKEKQGLSLATQLAIIGIIIVFIFVPFTQSTLMQAKNTGPSYNGQWQTAGGFVRNNTAADAIFAHWWDYGYYVQGGFDRPTITDGGNFIYAWNYFMGRNVLTGHSEQEALDFLYPHNASYLLIISDEIGKYPAYSSIGADKNKDRYSWIPTFTLDPNNVAEKRDTVEYLYTSGGTALDQDFIYNEMLFPKNIAGIGGFVIPLKKEALQNLSQIIFEQPIAKMVYNNKAYDIPVECVFFNDKKYIFNEATNFSNGLPACLRIMPTVTNQQMNVLGSLLYLSPEVSQTLFTKLYLFGEKSDNFEIFYNDEKSSPLILYNGYQIGPLKIWKIKYPSNIIYNATYIGSKLPDPEVMKV